MEPIILATCLILSPVTCKDIEIQVQPENGASLQVPFHCFRQGQIEAQKWIAEHSEWRVKKWYCPRKNKHDQET